MRHILLIGFIAMIAVLALPTQAKPNGKALGYDANSGHAVQLGPRPAFLVEDMDEGELKVALQQCDKGPFFKTKFSIGHRGAALQFPEHTKESYEAAAKMGAGIVECDVTFTKDRELVCRHSQCDLHTTTNIVATDLASKCTTPPEFDMDGKLINGPAIQCCTSDITLAEFKTLQGKMDSANPAATSIAGYMNATANFRTDLYANGRAKGGTLLTHAESIALFNKLGVDMTPELKSPSVEMPFEGDYTQEPYTREDYAQQMIDEYRAAGVDPSRVWPQSFDINDVRYWVAANPNFGKQAVFLDGRYDDPAFDVNNPATWVPNMEQLKAEGVQVIAPPLWMLVTEENGEIVPSLYAKMAKQAGLKIISWTLERSGPLTTGGGWYYQTTNGVINNDGDMMTTLDVLAKDVGVIGVFSDWPATTSYYANCMGIK